MLMKKNKNFKAQGLQQDVLIAHKLLRLEEVTTKM
jgi:hypothetical protein